MNTKSELEYYSKDEIHDRLKSLPEVDDKILAGRILEALSILETKLVERICGKIKNKQGIKFLREIKRI